MKSLPRFDSTDTNPKHFILHRLALQYREAQLLWSWTSLFSFTFQVYSTLELTSPRHKSNSLITYLSTGNTNSQKCLLENKGFRYQMHVLLHHFFLYSLSSLPIIFSCGSATNKRVGRKVRTSAVLYTTKSCILLQLCKHSVFLSPSHSLYSYTDMFSFKFGKISDLILSHQPTWRKPGRKRWKI